MLMQIASLEKFAMTLCLATSAFSSLTALQETFAGVRQQRQSSDLLLSARAVQRSMSLIVVALGVVSETGDSFANYQSAISCAALIHL